MRYTTLFVSTMTVTQKRFLTNPDEDINSPPSTFDYIWNVPLSLYILSGSQSTFQTKWLTTETGSFDLPGTPDLVVANNEYIAFARVLYEGKMLTNMLDTLNSNIAKITPFSRANFVSDYFAFAENTALTGVEIDQTLTNTQFMSQETDFTVWSMFSNGINYLRTILKFTNNKEVLDGYLQHLVDAYYLKHGWNQNLNTIR